MMKEKDLKPLCTLLDIFSKDHYALQKPEYNTIQTQSQDTEARKVKMKGGLFKSFVKRKILIIENKSVKKNGNMTDRLQDEKIVSPKNVMNNLTIEPKTARSNNESSHNKFIRRTHLGERKKIKVLTSESMFKTLNGHKPKKVIKVKNIKVEDNQVGNSLSTIRVINDSSLTTNTTAKCAVIRERIPKCKTYLMKTLEKLKSVIKTYREREEKLVDMNKKLKKECFILRSKLSAVSE